EGHIRLSSALRALKRFDEALVAAEKAVALDRNSHEAHHARALALGELGRLEELLEGLDKAEELGAPATDIDWNRANTLSSLGRVTEAKTFYERVLALRPADSHVRQSYGLALLHCGDYERGWQEHEARLERPDFDQRPIHQMAPKWRGEE